MSKATQNDLQYSNQLPADDAFTEPPPEIRDLLMKSASLVAKKGLEMEKRIMRSNEWNPKFNFLRSSDPFHAFYKLKVSEYCALLNQDGPAQYIQPDTPAITTHEYVRVHREPRYPPIFVLTNPPEGITLKEIGIIMLTAQFVARYGMYFLAGLMKRVSMNPQFEFMRETDDSCRCDYFTQLVVAYSRVLSPSQKLSERRLVCMETRFEDFFHHLQLEKLEEGVETAMSDLLAFVGVVDYFARMENNEESSAAVPPPQHFSMLMNPPPQMQPAIPVTPPLGPKAQLPPPSMDDSVPVAQAAVKIIGLPHDIRRMIEKTALLVSQEGPEIERRIRDCKVDDKIFNFLRSSDPYHGIYQLKVTEFRAWKQESDPDILPDIPSSLQDPIFPVGKPPDQGITLKELGLMKLTAQFSARYGMDFTMALMERGRVMTRNHFDFLELSDTRRCYFARLVIAYSRVLRLTDKLRERPGACAEPVLEAFFKLIQLEKLEEGVEMAMDVCAFVGGIEYFALVEEEWAETGMEDEGSDMGMGDEMSYMGIKGEEGRLLWGWKIMRPPPEEPESKRPKLAPRPVY